MKVLLNTESMLQKAKQLQDARLSWQAKESLKAASNHRLVQVSKEVHGKFRPKRSIIRYV
jgi:hypothetical protein